jgi:hypothetical protein
MIHAIEYECESSGIALILLTLLRPEISGSYQPSLPDGRQALGSLFSSLMILN